MASLKMYLIILANAAIASLLVYNLSSLIFDDAENENVSFGQIYEDLARIFDDGTGNEDGF